MNKIHFAALISGCLLFTGIATAQSVQFPTGNAAWTVDITYPHSDVAATPTPAVKNPAADAANRKAKKIEVAQVDKVKVIRVTWTSGPTTEEWTIPNLPVVFKEYPNGSVDSVESGGMELKLENFSMPYDASAFNWINQSNLQGTEPVTYLGKQCYWYKGTASVVIPTKEKPDSRAAAREAWIDSKTLLPVALNTGTSFCVFTFRDPPPVGPLVPPQKIQQEIAYYKRVMGFP